VALNGKTFLIPDGTELIVAATVPLIERPITADFDEQGYLYVSESSGSNDNVEKQLAEKPHRILRLEDVDGDGRFDRRTIFAEQMMFPEGTLWHEGSLYVAAPPSIWKLTDTDGDGVADQREEWFIGKTLTGCANDLHGPYLGRDGWIYWCKGAFAEQTYDTPGRGTWTTRAAHIFRRHPTEHWVEPVMTGGMDNPVDVVFTPSGERIFTTTFLQHPGNGRRDGLIHAIYGGVYGKDHGVLEGHLRTGDLMPVLTHLGAAAPSGLALLDAPQFGPEYQSNVVAALFNMHKITRHQLLQEGATFRTVDSDLIATENLDFHPTDILEDADGSLLAIDTGGWYKLCCPTSQLWKPDVIGAIYRLRKSGAQVTDARGLKLEWDGTSSDELLSRLSDDRPAVRRRAVQQYRHRYPESLSAVAKFLATCKSPATRREAIWLLCQIGSPEALAVALDHCAHETEPANQQAAMHAFSLWRYKPALPLAVQHLRSSAPQLQRIAAELVGRIGDRTSVAALLRVGEQPCDRIMEHAAIYALLELRDVKSLRDYLQQAITPGHRLALVALQQLAPDQISPDDTLALLRSPDEQLRETALQIVLQHSDWAARVAELLESLAPAELQDPGQGQRYLRAFSHTPAVQAWMATVLNSAEATDETKQTVLNAMAAASLNELPDMWHTSLLRLYAQPSVPAEEQLTTICRILQASSTSETQQAAWRDALLRTAEDPQVSEALQLEALAARPTHTPLSDRLVEKLAGQLSSDTEVAVRTLAIRALQRAELTTSQQAILAAQAAAVGPLELPSYLAIFAPTRERRVATTLVEQLCSNPSLAALPRETIGKAFEGFDQELQARVTREIERRTPDLEAMRAKITGLLQRLDQGDVRRGQQVFHGKQAACFSCHAMGYLGGEIGPDLTHIARTRTATDLLEAVLYPSASFVRSYEPWSIETNDGQVHNGILKENTSHRVVLVNNARETVVIESAEIASLQPSSTSIMPAGLDQQLTEQQLIDLIVYLREAK
jgi:putative membrane-bound dehydrogenase-like protein